ncbi:hypothetical protein ACET3Z_011940 [Daucus carota]
MKKMESDNTPSADGCGKERLSPFIADVAASSIVVDVIVAAVCGGATGVHGGIRIVGVGLNSADCGGVVRGEDGEIKR